MRSLSNRNFQIQWEKPPPPQSRNKKTEPKRNASYTFALYSQVIVSCLLLLLFLFERFFARFCCSLCVDSHSFISISFAVLFFRFCCTSKQIILCKTLFVTLVLTITHKYNWKCAREQNIANMKWTKKHTTHSHKQFTWRQLRVTRIEREREGERKRERSEIHFSTYINICAYFYFIYIYIYSMNGTLWKPENRN